MLPEKQFLIGLIGVAVWLLLMGLTESPAVSIGDSIRDVTQELGPPDGRMRMAGRTVLMYERGEVVMEGDRVVEVELMSIEDAALRRTQLEEAERERAELRRIEREANRVEGLEIRARKLADETFMNAPAGERVAYWRAFQGTYPDVSLGEEYSQALREYDLELQAKNAAAVLAAPNQTESREVIQPEPAYREDPFVYPTETYITTFGNRFHWYGSRIDPVLTRPARSYTPEQPSYGYGYQNPIEVPARPSRPMHPKARPGLPPAVGP
jgi:hypothetical protein